MLRIFLGKDLFGFWYFLQVQKLTFFFLSFLSFFLSSFFVEVKTGLHIKLGYKYFNTEQTYFTFNVIP